MPWWLRIDAHDIEILRRVRRLLHEDGHAIKTVQQMHNDLGLSGLLAAAGEAGPLASPPRSEPMSAAPTGRRPALAEDGRRVLQDSLSDLIRIKAELDRVLTGA